MIDIQSEKSGSRPDWMRQANLRKRFPCAPWCLSLLWSLSSFLILLSKTFTIFFLSSRKWLTLQHLSAVLPSPPSVQLAPLSNLVSKVSRITLTPKPSIQLRLLSCFPLQKQLKAFQSSSLDYSTGQTDQLCSKSKFETLFLTWRRRKDVRWDFRRRSQLWWNEEAHNYKNYRCEGHDLFFELNLWVSICNLSPRGGFRVVELHLRLLSSEVTSKIPKIFLLVGSGLEDLLVLSISEIARSGVALLIRASVLAVLIALQSNSCLEKDHFELWIVCGVMMRSDPSDLKLQRKSAESESERRLQSDERDPTP